MDLRQQLDRDGFITLEVSGSSMSPTLKEGSTIIVKPIDVIKMGDVVVIEGANNNLLVHRIAHKIKMGKKEWYIHIGDNSSYPGLASENEIVGRVDAPAVRTLNPFVTLLAAFLHLGAFMSHFGMYPQGITGNFNKTAVSTAKFLLHRMLAFGRLVPKNVI